MAAADGLQGVIGLRVPGTLAYRHLAIRFVTTACKLALESSELGGPGQLGAADTYGEPSRDDDGDEDGDDFVPEVISAFGEAFNNIAVHGFRDVAPQPVHIEVDWDLEKITITIVDRGRSFDPASVAPPDLDAMPESGMGLFIMTSCMDVVDYQPGSPNVLRLVKLRQRDGLLPPAPLGPQNDSGLAAGSRAPGSLASRSFSDFSDFNERFERLADDRAGAERVEHGERGQRVERASGIVEIEGAVDSSRPPGDAGRSVWRMKAVRTAGETRRR